MLKELMSLKRDGCSYMICNVLKYMWLSFRKPTSGMTKLPVLKNRFFPVTYHSTNSVAKSKGVSILMSGKVP